MYFVEDYGIDVVEIWVVEYLLKEYVGCDEFDLCFWFC